MVHSDRGIQYACDGFRKVLNDCGCIQSMSRKGNCWDNAVSESFFHVLKSEIGETFICKEVAYQEIFQYIEIDYNRNRTHSTLGYFSPVAFYLRLILCPLFLTIINEIFYYFIIANLCLT
jgi:putative transposase